MKESMQVLCAMLAIGAGVTFVLCVLFPKWFGFDEERNEWSVTPSPKYDIAWVFGSTFFPWLSLRLGAPIWCFLLVFVIALVVSGIVLVNLFFYNLAMGDVEEEDPATTHEDVDVTDAGMNSTS